MSSDHHQALVLARRVLSLAELGESPGVDRDAWSQQVGELGLAERFQVELEPHFRVEEELLLPRLVAAGEAALAGLVEAEHARLRALVSGPLRGQCPAPSELREFSELLTAHVRFEEREVFPCCERVLSEAELDEVNAARPHAW